VIADDGRDAGAAARSAGSVSHHDALTLNCQSIRTVMCVDAATEANLHVFGAGHNGSAPASGYFDPLRIIPAQS